MRTAKSRFTDFLVSGCVSDYVRHSVIAATDWDIAPDNVTFFCAEPGLDIIIWPKYKIGIMTGGRP